MTQPTQFPRIKPGDTVYCPRFGNKAFVAEHSNDTIYPIKISTDSDCSLFTEYGMYFRYDTHPLLFHNPPKYDFTPPKFQPKKGELCYFRM